MKKNSSHCSAAIYPSELPRMANPFARRIRKGRFQFLGERGINSNECSFSSEQIVNTSRSVDGS